MLKILIITGMLKSMYMQSLRKLLHLSLNSKNIFVSIKGFRKFYLENMANM